MASNDRIQHLISFYSVLDGLEKNIGGARKLAECSGRTPQNAHAQLYRYFSGGTQGRFSGEATLLLAIRVAMAFPPTTPAVTNS